MGGGSHPQRCLANGVMVASGCWADGWSLMIQSSPWLHTTCNSFAGDIEQVLGTRHPPCLPR